MFSRKSVSKKQLLTFFMKDDMKIYICFSCGKTSSPTKTKTHLSGWAQGEDIIKKKIPQYLLSSQSCVLFSKSAMTLYPHSLSSGQKWWEYENALQRHAHICSQLLNLGPFGPTVSVEHIVTGCAKCYIWRNSIRIVLENSCCFLFN